MQALVREPHYPLQLSKELGMSQQAVMKHLKVLESCHLVESHPEESDLGGPKRKKYVPTVNFTITVDMGPSLFCAKLVSLETRIPEHEEEEEQHDEATVSDLREHIAAIDKQLVELQKRRDALIEEKERTLDEVCSRMMSGDADYQLRRILYEFISRPDLGPTDIARELSLRDEEVLRTLRKILER